MPLFMEWSKSVPIDEHARSKYRWFDCAKRQLRSGPAILQAPSHEHAADARAWCAAIGTPRDQRTSRCPVPPPSSQPLLLDASSPRPVGSSIAASIHHDDDWLVVIPPWTALRMSASPAPPAPATPATPPTRQPPLSPAQTHSSQSWSSSSSSSDTPTARRVRRESSSRIRVIPPPWLDVQRGTTYPNGPSEPNAAFLHPDFLKASGPSPHQQRLSSNPSRISAMLSELHGHLQYTRKCRRKLKELRSRIRAIQDKKLDIENAFQSAAMRSTVQASAGNMLFKLSRDLENTRSEYHSLQMEYEALERELEQRESKLETSEIGLFQELGIAQVPGSYLPTSDSSERDTPHTLEHAGPQGGVHHDRATAETLKSIHAGHPDDEDNTAFAASIEKTLRGMMGNETTDIPPLYRKLVSTVAALKMDEEEHVDILEERQEIVSTLYNRFLIAASLDKTLQLDEAKMDQVRNACDSIFSVGITAEFRDLFGPSLVRSDLQFLEDFGRAEKKVLAAVREHTEQVTKLRSECLRTGAIPNHLAARERVVVLGEEDDDAHEISMDPRPDYNIAVGHSRLPNPLTHAYFPILRHNCWYLLTKSPMTAKSALTQMLQLPTNFPYRAARVEDLVKEYGIETMLTRFAPKNKADFVNRWLLQQLRLSSVNELELFAISSKHLGIVDPGVWQRNAISFWARDGTNELENPIHGSEVSSSPTVCRTATEMLDMGQKKSNGDAGDGAREQHYIEMEKQAGNT